MIDEIQVENVALIREARLRPSRGMTVLTGETGAGKTALLSALKLLIGQRADKTAIREGSEGLRVSGRFFPLHCDSGTSDDESEGVVVQRSLSIDGRSRVEVDGRMASVSQLASLIGESIDLCGQHDQQQLMKTANHGRLLDAWAGDALEPALEAYRKAFTKASEAKEALDRLERLAESSAEELESARFVLRHIDEIDPLPGEYEQLKEDLARSEHAEALCRAALAACEALGGEGGVQEGLTSALHALESASAFDKTLTETVDALRDAGFVIEDVLREVSAYADGFDFDPEDLQCQQERMAALQGLLRNFGPRMEDVFERRERAQALVSATDDSAFLQERARKAFDRAEKDLAASAEELATRRCALAPRFAEEVTKQMRRLEMQGACLLCSVQDLPRKSWTKAGSQSVEFLFQAAEGMQPRPFVRIASGGEISRVMLAVKVVLGQADRVDTLVFDEIDAGVGGSTALSLAEVLADLAETHQVIVVSHLAQIAAAADVHYLVRKTQPSSTQVHMADEEVPVQSCDADGEASARAGETNAGPFPRSSEADGDVSFPSCGTAALPTGLSSEKTPLPETRLELLSASERPAEIARMLSGAVTGASLAAANEMLARHR